MSAESTPDIDRERAKAVGDALARCTAGIGATSKTGRELLFSGVFVRYHEKPLVVTASHCVKEVGNLATLRMISAKKKTADKAPRLRAGRGYGDTDRLDVAFLELEPDDAAGLVIDWIEEDQLTDEGLEIGDIVCLRGFPGEWARAKEGPPVNVIRKEVVFATEVLPPRGSAQLSHSDEIRLQFDEQLCFDVRTGEPANVPEPFGMSGAGVFTLGELQTGKIWSPRDVRLVGVQSAVLKTTPRVLLAIPIRVVKALLLEYYGE